MPWNNPRQSKQRSLKKETRESRETWRNWLARFESGYNSRRKIIKCLKSEMIEFLSWPFNNLVKAERRSGSLKILISFRMHILAVLESLFRSTIAYISCLGSWCSRIYRLVLFRGVRPRFPMSVLNMTLNNLMVRFQ